MPRRKRSFLANHVNSEHFQQARFFAKLSRINHPAIESTVAIPNQALALLTKPARVHFSKEGCKAGVLDVLVAYPSKGFGCLWLEFKRPGETLSPEQRKWRARQLEAGNQVHEVNWAEEALKLWCEYIGIPLS